MLCVNAAMLYHLSNELTNTLRAGQFVEFVLKPVKGMKHERPRRCGQPLRVVGLGRDGTLRGT